MAGEAQRDLVLAPSSFAWVLDGTSGLVNTLVGPTKHTLSEQQRAVILDKTTRKFLAVAPDQGVQQSLYAPQGSYIVLENPAKVSPGMSERPAPGNQNQTPLLDFGNRINIPGPANIPLWPLQSGEVIPGHSLRSNQYIVGRVVDAETAKANWNRQISAPSSVTATEGEAKKIDGGQPQGAQQAFASIDVNKLVTGQLFIIKGTEISFYIPPSGVEVTTDDRTGKKVREANTLEALEYSILVNERGEKRYERGPAVVFPDPTETFQDRQNSQGEMTRRFRAIALTPLQGIYVQVIKKYNDDGSPTEPDARKAAGLPEKPNPDHKQGDELFITGKDQPIYYPNDKHAIIRFGEHELHNAVAIPKGEGRYVLNRRTGEIKLVKGPKMLLANPIEEVIVRRILTDKQVQLWFPGNEEARTYNQTLAAVAEEADVASQSFVSDTTIRSRSMRTPAPAATKGGMEALEATVSYGSPTAAKAQFGNALQRGGSFTPPRTVTIDTKYDGAVNISPHTGFAVSVVAKTGERRVVVGPATHLLEYDETLDVVSLSRGTPKNHDVLTPTVYLQIWNNRVTELYEVETSDMVRVDLKVSCRLNFEGDPTKWFSDGNYVKLLTQYIRSRLSSAVKKFTIGDFYNRAIQIVRDTILGEAKPEGEGKPSKRTGLPFNENGMRIFDVEVLSVKVNDKIVADLMQNTMIDGFKATMEIATLQRKLETTKKREEINQQIAEEEAATKRKAIGIQVEQVIAEFGKLVKQRENELADQSAAKNIEIARQDVEDARTTAQIARQGQQAEFKRTEEQGIQELRLAFITAETEAVVNRVKGINGPLGDILLALSSQEFMGKLAAASAPMSILGGTTIVDVLGKAFEGTGFQTGFEMAKRQLLAAGGDEGQWKGLGGVMRRGDLAGQTK